MDNPFLIWAGIISVVMLLFIIDAIKACRRTKRAHGRHLLEIGKEREMLFIPGDPSPRIDDDYDFEDFEDL